MPPLTGGYSAAFLFSLKTLSNYSGLFSWQPGTTLSGIEIRLGIGPTDSKLWLRHGNNATGYRYYECASGTFAANSPLVTLVIASGSLVQDVPTVVVNGRERSVTSTGTATGDIEIAGTPSVCFGSRTEGTTFLDGMIYHAAFWNRRISAAEALEWSQYPWSLYQPIRRRVWVSVGASSITGTGTLAAQAATLSGTGTGYSTGTGTLAAQAAALSGSGSVGGIIGTGALVSQYAALAGVGNVSWQATGALAAAAATLSATGASSSTGTGTLTAGSSDVTVNGLVSWDATGTLVAQAADVTASGTSSSTGTGALSSQAATASGAGTSGSTGTGALQAQSASIFGIGFVGILEALVDAFVGFLRGIGRLGR
jgi:hypothetical protein